jgi:hypothetical protein
VKHIIDYICAIFPLNETQKDHLVFLVESLIHEHVFKSKNKYWLEGYQQGLKHGRLEGKMLAAGLSNEELEDFYKQQSE